MDKNDVEKNDLKISVIELINSINEKSSLYKILTFISYLTKSNN